ncbi:hypothetical protein Tco_0662401 [Tanacetum coccineum]
MYGLGLSITGDGLLIQEGSSVKATGKIAQIPVSEAYLGRVVNALAKPIDGRERDNINHLMSIGCIRYGYSFNAAYKRAKRLRKSGKNDVDLIKRAQSIYRDEHKGVSFSQEDAWAILKFHPKWDAPEQVELTGDVPGATQEDLFGHDARPRPAGKPRPARKPNPTPRRAPVEVARQPNSGS